MYFPIGWPKILDTPENFEEFKICKIVCDCLKVLFAILTEDSICIWYIKPCVPIVQFRRSPDSIRKHGKNIGLVSWKLDSSMLVVATEDGTLLFFNISLIETPKGVYNQADSPFSNLRRDSAELFIKETIPSLVLTLAMEVPLYVPVTSIVSLSSSQMMIATKDGRVLRYKWDGTEDRDFTLDLKRIPFSINQQVSYAVPITEGNTYITGIDYSPLISGFAVTLNDGRAAFLTANNLRFDPNQVQGIWAPNLEDATCTCINHKYRLIAFGRKNSQAVVYTIDDGTGGLELSHVMILSAKDFPGSAGAVTDMKWTPDGCAIVMSWSKGGISLWSTFGAMLMCSLGWDYGLQVDLQKENPLDIISMDWSTDGYQLFMVRREKSRQYLNRANSNNSSTININNSDSSNISNNNNNNDTISDTPKMPKKQILVQTNSNSSIQSNASSSAPSVAAATGVYDAQQQQRDDDSVTIKTSLIQLDFVKSVLAVNPCMSFNSHLFLQGDDKLYINQGDSLQKIYYNCKTFATDTDGIGPSPHDSPLYTGNKLNASYNICTNSYINGEIKLSNEDALLSNLDDYEVGKSLRVTNMLSESKHWIIVQLPIAYSASNWPIKYSAIDKTGTNIAVAGRTGIALYSMTTRKWKLFGNETQERDFVATGGLLWWNDFIIMGCYSIVDHNDELRLYPKDNKLDNRNAKIIPMRGLVMLINLFKDQLIVFTADGYITVFSLIKHDSQNVDLLKLHAYDLRGLIIHPACIISVTMSNLRNESSSRVNQGYAHVQPETIVLNVSGRLLTVQKEMNGNMGEQLSTTCLASCVECLWISDSQKLHLKESLWLFCGGHGMRVWLPVFPREGESGQRSHRHTFMSKRIMLSFSLRVYPLAVLFEDAIILGAENDTILYTSDQQLHFSLPYCVLERTSQVYLHQLLRQLIRRNLGYNAWEIARSCTNLPYFPHSLELLLHEVLEEEATSKEPIPDALLPSVLEFIQEFPVYLQTVVQCARKTEIALWPYLFATAGKPKELFQQCLTGKQLETAASYLIILQNLEPSAISRQYATLLLDTALEQRKWDLAKDLVRFLRAIDPNDVESPRTSFVMGNKLNLSQHTPTPNVSPNAEDLSLILGSMARGRSFSTTMGPTKQNDMNSNSSSNSMNNNSNQISNNNNSGNSATIISSGSYKEKSIFDASMVMRRKKSVPNTQKEKESSSAEEFFIDVILQRHARRLLQDKRLEDLGYMSAALDFHLVGWLAREKDRAARIEDFVLALKQLHEDLDWPKPCLDLKLDRRGSEKSSSVPQQESPSYSLQSLRVDTNIGTDSGYTSLPTYNDIETPTVHCDVQVPISSFSPILENQILSTTHSSVQGRSDSLLDTEAKLVPIQDTNSVVSEQVSLWGDDMSGSIILSQEIDQSFNQAMENLAVQNSKKIPHKLEVKMRYLLQIFTEAGCLEFSLLISMILLDAASICRITNTAIRTGSLAICRQLRNGLKDVTRWSFHECLGYRPFMMALQPQIALLDKFVIQQESIPNFLQPAAMQPSSNQNVNLLKLNDKNELFLKNTQSSIIQKTGKDMLSLQKQHHHHDDDDKKIKKLSKALSTSDSSTLNQHNHNSNDINNSDSLSLSNLPKPESTGCAIM